MRAELGTITCPAGRLVIADTGYLGLWSGTAAPVAGESLLVGIADPAMRESVLAAADLAIVGPDAERAARGFDRQRGTWLYDIPGHGVDQITEAFTEHCAAHGLVARLEREDPRVPHRERAERAVRAGGEEFIMQGVPVVAIGALPGDREIRVIATSQDFGGSVGVRWESVTVEVSGAEAVSSRELGVVGVDAARLSLIDADGLGAWQHDEPVDGLADVAFWGRAADEAAEHFAAPLLGKPGEEKVRGWTDLDVRAAVERAIALEEWMDADPGRRMAVDFRPHSHHFQVMEQVRAAELEVGAIEVGGGRSLAFMTGWGDGLFPVHAALDADGGLVRIRIVLGDERRRQILEDLHDEWE